LLSAGLTLLALQLGAQTYAPEAALWDKLCACLRRPAIVVLNLLPPLLLSLLGWLLTRRVWAGYLLAAVPTLALAASNLWKVALRGDPVLFSDLRLLRTAGGILSRYELPFDGTVLHALLWAALGLVLSVLLAAPTRLCGRTRALGLMAWLTVAPLLLAPCYLSEASYAATENHDFVTEFSENEEYASRGPWYSFLHTAPDVFSAVPDNYTKLNAERTIARYRDADIPEEQKVQVLGVMLEAFCDLTDYPALAQHAGTRAVYAPLHALEQRAVSGNLITNIFAGGTVESEWNFLTGLCHHGEFTAPLDSYVRYFAAQGYDTEFLHPGYSWFYDRRSINAYLGFERSVFTEDGFGELVDPEYAPYRSDGVLYDYILRELDGRSAADAPLFSFSVTYQNHGPYGENGFDGAVVTPEDTGWSATTCGILSHYLYGIENSIAELCRFTDELETRTTPVVVVFFGDHKPWLGNEKSVYKELGINMDMSTEEGLRNAYQTPYLIYANAAAKQALGQSFTGLGGDISPCLLMEELFDCCGWEGPAFLQLARDMRALSPLLHVRGCFLLDGVFLTKDELPKDVLDFYLNYRDVEVWRETYALSEQGDS
ncbi:MAG: LTA synthase family protein, partial [Oscillospiraceae bacterium]|nr:LTA synthase family protein [Oscillospiraceae bacterium]